MKKKVLFLCHELDSGGVSKSFISLLNTFNKNRFEVYVLLGKSNGIFTKMLPDGIINLSDYTSSFGLGGLVKGIKGYLNAGLPLKACFKIIGAVISRFSITKGAEFAQVFYPQIDIEFDVAVDYNGQAQLYYMVNKIKAKKKITFFHNDYRTWMYYYKADQKYYGKVDLIFSISDTCVEALQEVFPAYADKCRKMENILPSNFISKLADESLDPSFPKEGITILTVGHICERKGTGLAIKAASLMKKKGINYTWHFIGTQNELVNYLPAIKQMELGDRLHFWGVKENPYPFVKAANIYVQPSQIEGKSIALDEAKILCKPIVVTNFSTVTDQFTDRVNGTICKMNPEALSNAIIELITNDILRNKYIKHLQQNLTDNSSQVEIIYNLL